MERPLRLVTNSWSTSAASKAGGAPEADSSPLEELAGACGIQVIALVSGPVDAVEQIVAEGRPIPETCLLPGCHRARIRPRRSR